MNKNIWLVALLVVAGCVAVILLTRTTETSSDPHDHAGHSHLDHNSAEADMADWCAEHAVPESECTRCNRSLIESFKAAGDWCLSHDLPESHCRLCNPELVFPQELQNSAGTRVSDWCAEHAVPESQCTICNPALIETFKAAGDWCAPHNLPESHCRLCNPGIMFPQEQLLLVQEQELPESSIEVSLYFRPNRSICATNDALIRFTSESTVERSGISTAAVLAANQESTIEAPAEAKFDENSTMVIASTARVVVSRWLIEPGEVVEKGDPIAVLQSPEIAELQARAISAAAELEVQAQEVARHQSLIDKELITKSEFERVQAQYRKAEADLTAVRGLLRTSGMGSDDIERLLTSRDVSNQFTLRSSASGLVAERIAQVGELLEEGEPLAILTNPGSMWIEARLTEDQMRHVEVGQKLLFSTDQHSLDRSTATIIWVSPYLDPHTRTGTVRARVDHVSGQLRAGEFGNAWIMGDTSEKVTLVPKNAVQWEGCCNVVFVREARDRFRPRKVTITNGPDSYYRVIQGVSVGEEVVVKGSFLLKTELKKSSIGAGCCGIEPVG